MAPAGKAALPQRRAFPVDRVREFLEPGPIVLVTSAHAGERNVMTLGWHVVLGFTPSRIGFYLWDANHSFALVRGSRECVVNLPTADMVDSVVDIGNCSGRDVDKFERFGLATRAARDVGAPLLTQCHASFECRLADDAMVDRHGFFVWDVVRAHAAPVPKRPKTLHYHGDGQFMVAGRTISRRGRFRPDMLP